MPFCWRPPGFESSPGSGPDPDRDNTKTDSQSCIQYYREIKNNHRLIKKIPALFYPFISTKSDGFCNGRCFLKVRARRPFCEHNPPPHPPTPL